MNRIIMASIALSALLMGCMTTAQSMIGQPLYETTEREIERLEGDVTVTELLLHKDSTMTRTEFISLAVYDSPPGDDHYGSIILRLDSSSWRFPNNLGVSINGNTRRLEPDNESTEVISGTYVSETYWFNLGERMREDLSDAETLRFQIPGSDIITVPSEGVARAREFVESI